MKFRHLEKVKVKGGYYRNYKGVVQSNKVGKDNIIFYVVELTIKKEPLLKRVEEFREDELKRSWF